MDKKLISIFTPVYNEEENIRHIYERVRRVMEPLEMEYDYEHVFSDNCSTDASFHLLKEIHENDSRVKVIRLSKNFGITPNAFNGILRCRGDAVVQVDADLQDPPEMIKDFIKNWEDGCMVVYGVREDRYEFFLMKWIRKLFYRISSALATDTLLPDVGEFRLMDKCVINELKKINDHNPYLRGVIANIGFKQKGIPYKRNQRVGGRTSNNLWTLFDYGINGIISHSRIMLRLSTFVGFFIMICALAMGAFYVVYKVLNRDTAEGVTSILALLCFFAGIQMFFFGIMGEYIAKIYDQSIARPIVIEQDLLGFDDR